jgi:hypothetical protein
MSAALKRVLVNDGFLILFVFMIALSGFFWGEKLSNVGMYGDEIGYSRRARDLYQSVFVKGENSYHLQKILPSALAHVSMRAMGMDLNDENVLKIFGIWTVILLTFMAWLWCLIVRELSISQRGKWLGFIAFFVNFAILKYAFYCPISTDFFGYALAMSMFYTYITDRFGWMYFVIILSMLTWPTLSYVGIILSIFPARKSELGPWQPASYYLNDIAAFAITVFMGSMMVFWFTGGHQQRSFATGVFTTDANQPLLSVLYLSIAISLAYLYSAIRVLFDHKKNFDVKFLWNSLSILRPLIVLATVMLIKACLYHVSIRRQAVYSFGYLLKDTLGESLVQPGIFLVAHVVYYGPAIIILLFCWKPFCRLVQAFGPGLLICTAICVVLGLNSESRRLVNFYPFIIPLLVKATDSLQWRTSYYWLIGGIALVYSKFWFKIHTGPWKSLPQEWPNQNYYMNFGPWMANEVYYAQTIIIMITAVCLYFMLYHHAGTRTQTR